MNKFLGANTPQGFYSYYGNILDVKKNNRLIILKGGSGVGKSTLMKKVKEFCDSLNLSTQCYLCSSDTSSLDGLLIKELGIAIVDGTAPHVVEPLAYGAYDEVVNLGEAIDVSKCKNAFEHIFNLISKKAMSYAMGYEYLGAAYKVYGVIAKIYEKNLVGEKYDELLNEFINFKLNNIISQVMRKENNESDANNTVKLKKMFITAVTNDGYVDNSSELLKAKNVFVVRGAFDNIKNMFVSTVAEYLFKSGFDIEGYCSVIAPEQIQSIYVPDLDLAIVSTSILTKGVFNADNYIELDKVINNIDIDKKEIETACKEIKSLYNFAYAKFALAKAFHMDIEKIYSTFVDYGVVNKKTEQIIMSLQK